MGDNASDPLVEENGQGRPGQAPEARSSPSNAGTGAGAGGQLLQCLLVFVPRAFDAQQCFITTFTDSSSYPSNILSEWSLGGASPLLTSLPTAAFYAGCLLSGFLLTPLADTRLGRKNLLLVSCLLMSLSALLTSFSPDIYVYSALRFASGFGRAPISSSSIVLAAELAQGSPWRPYSGLLGFVLFALGFASLPGIAFLCRHSSWRNIYTWTSIPALSYCVVLCLLVRESPQWTRSEGAVYSSLSALVSRKWSRRRLGMVMVLAFGVGMVYYGMPLGLGTLDFNLYLSVLVEALVELPAALAALCLIGTVDRKRSLLATTAACGVCSVACGALSGASSWVQVGLELLAFLFGCTAVDISLLYIAELFPTCVRSTALAMTRQTAMLGAGAGAVLAAVGESQGNELITYGGFGAVVLASGVFVVWLPETRRTEPCHTMEDEEWKYQASSM